MPRNVIFVLMYHRHKLLEICSKLFFFLSFRAIFCFTNPDYRFIRTTTPPLITPDYRGFAVLVSYYWMEDSCREKQNLLALRYFQ
jgi:hypothetical protein